MRLVFAVTALCNEVIDAVVDAVAVATPLMIDDPTPACDAVMALIDAVCPATVDVRLTMVASSSILDACRAAINTSSATC